jgi:hypothetical protein
VSDYTARKVENPPANYARSTAFDKDLVVTDDPATVENAKAAVDDLAKEEDLPPDPWDDASEGDVNPALAGTKPADDAVDVAVDSDIVLTFNEDVTAGTGVIRVFNAGDGSLVEAVPVGNAVFEGATVRVDLTAVLEPGTAYYVWVEAGVIQDLAGNAFAGITNPTAFNFTTAGETPPVEPVELVIVTMANLSAVGVNGDETSWDAGDGNYRFELDADVVFETWIDNFDEGDVLFFDNSPTNDVADINVTNAAWNDGEAVLVDGWAVVNLLGLENDWFNNASTFMGVFGNGSLAVG